MRGRAAPFARVRQADDRLDCLRQRHVQFGVGVAVRLVMQRVRVVFLVYQLENDQDSAHGRGLDVAMPCKHLQCE